MAEAPKTNVRLEIAHVLFIDIVGYSARPTDEQQGLVDQLNQVNDKGSVLTIDTM